MNRHSNSASPVRSPSPHPPTSYLSATPTPSQHTSPSHLPHPSPFSRSISKTKYQAIDVLSEYQQRESSGKSRINLVVVGMLCQLLELLSYQWNVCLSVCFSDSNNNTHTAAIAILPSTTHPQCFSDSTKFWIILCCFRYAVSLQVSVCLECFHCFSYLLQAMLMLERVPWWAICSIY